MSIFRRVSFLGFALVSLVVLAACGGDGAGPASPTPTEESRTVTSDDGKLTLEIPPEALDEDVQITITSVPLEELPQALQEVRGAGDGYRLEPEGLRFLGPVTVSLELDRDELEDEPEGGITAYALVSLTEDGERELLDEPVTEATLGEDTIVVRGELGHFSWLTRTKSSLTFFLEKVKREQPVGGKFTAKMKAKNTDKSGRVTLAFVNGNILDFGAVSYDGGSNLFSLSIPGLGGVGLKPGEESFEQAEPFRCAESPGRGTYGVSVLSISKVALPDEPEGEIRAAIKLVMDSVIECVAPTPTPTATHTPDTDEPTPTPTSEADEPTPTPTPNLSSDTEPKVAFSDASNDAFDCAGGEDAVVVDLAVDMLFGGVTQLPDGVVVRVSLGVRPIESAKDASIAVQAQIGQEGRSQVAQYEFSGGQPNNGRLDDAGNVIPGSEGDVTATGVELTFTFPGLVLKKGDTVTVRSSHQRNPEDAVNCDVTDAFLLDELVP